MLRSLAPLLLVLASIVSYFVLATNFGVFQRVPWPHLLVAAAASVWILIQAFKTRKILAFVSALLCLGLTGMYSWYTLSYSNYDPGQVIAEGQQLDTLPGMRLATHDGTEKAVLAGKGTLIVFYRGFW